MNFNKHHIIRKCEKDFTRKQNQTILQLLKEMNAKVNECADGCHINLDLLTADQITGLKRKIDSVDDVPAKYKMF